MTRFAAAFLTSLIAGVLTPTTQATAQFATQSVQFFHAADVNGDELLTLPEFRTFIQYMARAGAPMSQRIAGLSAYGVAFRQVDANGDGVATPAELRAAERTN